MDLILLVGFAILGVAGAASSKIIADEFKAWSPWVIHRLIQRAVSNLPESCRARYEEEWRSHVNEVPGDVGKLIVAVGLQSAARKMNVVLADKSAVRRVTDGIKLALDVGIAATYLLILLPLIIAAATGILLERGPSVLRRETRVGLNGRPFSLITFNTPKCECAGLSAGTILRRLRLDAIPQIINVLRGEMSFVGPRPLRPNLAAELSAKIPGFDERHSVRPGITGWAQINHPCGQTLNDEFWKFGYDAFYVKHRGMLFDLIILSQTLRMVFWPPHRDVPMRRPTAPH